MIRDEQAINIVRDINNILTSSLQLKESACFGTSAQIIIYGQMRQ